MTLIPGVKALCNPDAKVILRETERERRRRWLESLAGSEIEIIIRRPARQRTLDQSNYLHAVPFRLIADRTGDLIEATKRNVMRDIFGYVHDLPTGLAKPWMEHTSSMTVEEADYLIERLPPFCLDRFDGLEVPLPGEVEYR